MFNTFKHYSNLHGRNWENPGTLIAKTFKTRTRVFWQMLAFCLLGLFWTTSLGLSSVSTRYKVEVLRKPLWFRRWPVGAAVDRVVSTNERNKDAILRRPRTQCLLVVIDNNLRSIMRGSLTLWWHRITSVLGRGSWRGRRGAVRRLLAPFPCCFFFF